MDPDGLQHRLVELQRGCAVRARMRLVVEHPARRLATATGGAGLVTCRVAFEYDVVTTNRARIERMHPFVPRTSSCLEDLVTLERPGLARRRGWRARRTASSPSPLTIACDSATRMGARSWARSGACGRTARDLANWSRRSRTGLPSARRHRGGVRPRRPGRAVPRPRRREGLRRSRRRPADHGSSSAHSRFRGSGRRQGADRRGDADRILGRARRARAGRGAGLRGGGDAISRPSASTRSRTTCSRCPASIRRGATRRRRGSRRSRPGCATTSTASAGRSRVTTTGSRSGTSIVAGCSPP